MKRKTSSTEAGKGTRATAKKASKAKAPSVKAARPKTGVAGARASAARAATMAPPDPARVAAILTLLDETYPDATTALDWQDPVQLLVATILSAQCTDERVNQVTPALFARFPDAAALAAAKDAELEGLIKTTGFFRNKAKAIKGAAKILAQKHGGEIPQSMESMLELPGVARKTANVVLGTAFNLPTGIVVDTHMKRVAARLALTAEEDPVKIERDLMALVPRERWVHFSHAMVLHGRHVCRARKPLCATCPLAPHCPSAGTFGEPDGVEAA